MFAVEYKPHLKGPLKGVIMIQTVGPAIVGVWYGGYLLVFCPSGEGLACDIIEKGNLLKLGRVHVSKKAAAKPRETSCLLVLGRYVCFRIHY